MQPTRDTKINVRQFQQQQLEQFDALLANYNWSSVFNTSGIDRKVNTFLQITENTISEYFPEKTVRIYSKDKPFMISVQEPVGCNARYIIWYRL